MVSLSILLCNIHLHTLGHITRFVLLPSCPTNPWDPVHRCIYAANRGAISAGSRSCAKEDILPFCLISAARLYSPTHFFTSVISGHWSRIGRLMVVSCVKPTPKLMSSGSCSTIVSSVAVGIGGFSRSLSKASQV